MNSGEKEIIDLFNRYPKLLKSWLSELYPFTEAQIEKHADSLNWSSLSLNEQIIWTPEFIHKHESKLDWEYGLCKNGALPWSIDFLSKYGSKFGSQELLSGNLGMPFTYEFLNHFKYKWNYRSSSFKRIKRYNLIKNSCTIKYRSK